MYILRTCTQHTTQQTTVVVVVVVVVGIKKSSGGCATSSKNYKRTNEPKYVYFPFMPISWLYTNIILFLYLWHINPYYILCIYQKCLREKCMYIHISVSQFERYGQLLFNNCLFAYLTILRTCLLSYTQICSLNT